MRQNIELPEMQFRNEEEQLRYLRARNRVKEIKSFYKHLSIYLAVNIFILLAKFMKHNIVTISDFSLSLWWGLALAIHGVVVFLPQFFLGQNWEERKTREVMSKYRNE